MITEWVWFIAMNIDDVYSVAQSTSFWQSKASCEAMMEAHIAMLSTIEAVDLSIISNYCVERRVF